MGTKTAMAAHSVATLGQVAAGVTMTQASDPWYSQVLVQAAGIGLQLLFAFINSRTDQKGNRLPPVTP